MNHQQTIEALFKRRIDGQWLAMLHECHSLALLVSLQGQHVANLETSRHGIILETWYARLGPRAGGFTRINALLDSSHTRWKGIQEIHAHLARLAGDKP